ncbi:DUF3299 domain-containing protein [Spongiibacter taiwanensis]|uniref:DUF3299 domain-containing protein n=1 Tax=Spongiibacter taiwanensis TaxID=1748242 RepID=UPI0020355598|nr:DUF3299 domain-containing protein [Spongiibacter taiwanensis]USA42813.1 DUF3299 domain-containing protein [Spongiibacter taiwanensis]
MTQHAIAQQTNGSDGLVARQPNAGPAIVNLEETPLAFIDSRHFAAIALFFLLAALGNVARGEDNYQTIEWTELMPKDDLEAFLNPPDTYNEIEDGSEADEIASQIKAALDAPGDSRYEQALVSTRVVPEFDGKAIRMPGFIVPLEFGANQQQVTKFFLVPYFGACIHVPPPPPNQIVYAEYAKGFKLESLYQPYWLSGTLRTTLIENDMATAAYAIKVDRLEPYTEE